MNKIQIAVMVFNGDRIVFPRHFVTPGNEVESEAVIKYSVNGEPHKFAESIFTIDLKFVQSYEEAMSTSPQQIASIFEIKYRRKIKDIVTANFVNADEGVTRVWFLATLDVGEVVRDFLLAGAALDTNGSDLIHSSQYDAYLERQIGLGRHETYQVANSSNWYLEELLQKYA